MVSTPTLRVSASQCPSSHPPAPAPASTVGAAVRNGNSQGLQQIVCKSDNPVKKRELATTEPFGDINTRQPDIFCIINREQEGEFY